MTRAEFKQLQELQLAMWPHGREQASALHLEVVYDLWGALAYEDVRATLKALAADGREFPPPPGVVVAKVAERQAAAAGGSAGFDEVWAAFERANRLGAFHEIAHPEARRRLAAGTPPDVLAFVERHYRDYAMSGGPDGDPVGVVRGQLRQLWEQGQQRRQSESAHGLAGVTPLPALRRVDGNGAPAPRGALAQAIGLGDEDGAA